MPTVSQFKSNRSRSGVTCYITLSPGPKRVPNLVPVSPLLGRGPRAKDTINLGQFMKHQKEQINTSDDLFAHMMKLRPQDDHDEEFWVFAIIYSDPNRPTLEERIQIMGEYETCCQQCGAMKAQSLLVVPPRSTSESSDRSAPSPQRVKDGSRGHKRSFALIQPLAKSGVVCPILVGLLNVI